MPQLLVFVLFFAGVYFLLLRPQQQRVRRQRQLITAISVGDRVVTAGGLIGRVVDESDDRLWVEISDGVIAEFLRMAISRRLDDSEPGFGGISDGGGEEDSGEFAEGEANGDADGEADGDAYAEVASDETEAIAAEAAPEAAVVNEAPAPAPAPGAVAPPTQPTLSAMPGEAAKSETAAPAPGPDPH
ncbi:MAG: preprotein translocase subunit YajC [Acidimicrobiaceae bacterium]|nr:preprotein translocase subunit YajC [Acidimicrobiaceae bacterium]